MPSPDLSAAQETEHRPFPRANGHVHQILLGEDDPLLRRIIAASLRVDGHEVSAFPDGIRLFNRAHHLCVRGYAPDLVVTDARMPGMDGLDVLAAIRARWDVPVVVITAFGDRHLHEVAQAYGAAAVFDKPFDLEDLRTVVLHVLKMSRRPSAH